MADRIRMFWILLLENRSKNNIFRNKIINLSFNGLAFNTREHLLPVNVILTDGIRMFPN